MNRIDETGVEWVTMQHSDSQGEAEVTKQAFEEVWQDKGWALKDTGDAAAARQGVAPDEVVNPASESDAVDQVEENVTPNDRRAAVASQLKEDPHA